MTLAVQAAHDLSAAAVVLFTAIALTLRLRVASACVILVATVLLAGDVVVLRTRPVRRRPARDFAAAPIILRATLKERRTNVEHLQAAVCNSLQLPDLGVATIPVVGHRAPTVLFVLVRVQESERAAVAEAKCAIALAHGIPLLQFRGGCTEHEERIDEGRVVVRGGDRAISRAQHQLVRGIADLRDAVDVSLHSSDVPQLRLALLRSPRDCVCRHRSGHRLQVAAGASLLHAIDAVNRWKRCELTDLPDLRGNVAVEAFQGWRRRMNPEVPMVKLPSNRRLVVGVSVHETPRWNMEKNELVEAHPEEEPLLSIVALPWPRDHRVVHTEVRSAAVGVGSQKLSRG
mmetsp:Transcript_75361/g.245090  ORF Transcript_75361/g.245090 Transcript_75361/m.245090 type:complete len:345 (-) Transcript_75361:1006-2040(-)